MGDETVKVFLNASGTADDVSSELADFMSYLKEKKGKSKLVKKIDAEVKKARAHEEWRVEYMTLQMKFRDIYDDAWDEGLEAGMEAGLEAGMQKGLEVGMEKGMEEGLQKGMQKGVIETLQNLVEKNLLPLETAAKEAHMTVEEFRDKLDQRKKKQSEMSQEDK